MIYRLTKYIILILIFLVLIISGSLFIITKIYSEEIKELALEKINQQAIYELKKRAHYLKANYVMYGSMEHHIKENRC